MTVCFELKLTSTFLLHVFLFLFFFFFFFFSPQLLTICVLSTVPQITLFSNFFIKNGSHNTIYTFKNYFATVFSVSIFSFSKNKLNPNTPIILKIDISVKTQVTFFGISNTDGFKYHIFQLSNYGVKKSYTIYDLCIWASY